MNFHAIVIPFTCFLLFQHSNPIELIPVDAGVEDRGALSGSLRLEQADMRQDHAFEKLYKVAGSDDIYVRKSGGLSAIFRTSQYVQTPKGEIPIVPAGTVYCIGEIPPELIQQLGTLQKPLPDPESMVHPERVETISARIPIREKTISQTFAFLDDEAYRRERLTSFVLEIVLSN